ncbi:MAG: hypothetical protein KDB68_07465 [Planctomycetes bacterium]|nr:hypothetical protein [Planctomycetota bacterium]
MAGVRNYRYRNAMGVFLDTYNTIVDDLLSPSMEALGFIRRKNERRGYYWIRLDGDRSQVLIATAQKVRASDWGHLALYVHAGFKTLATEMMNIPADFYLGTISKKWYSLIGGDLSRLTDKPGEHIHVSELTKFDSVAAHLNQIVEAVAQPFWNHFSHEDVLLTEWSRFPDDPGRHPLAFGTDYMRAAFVHWIRGRHHEAEELLIAHSNWYAQKIDAGPSSWKERRFREDIIRREEFLEFLRAYRYAG